MMKRILSFLALSALAIQANAQFAPGGFSPLAGAAVTDDAPLRNGFHLFGAALSAGYSSSLGWVDSSWNPGVTHPIYYEDASILIGYTHVNPHGALAIGYSPSYSGLNGMGGLQFLNQRFSLGYSRSYGPKWTLRVRGEAADTTFEDFLFLTNPADALSGFSAAAAGAAVRDAALTTPQTLLYGNRQLMYTARVGFEYRPSTRLKIAVDAGVDQLQALRQTDYSFAPLIPRARTEVANVGVTYAFSTRTELQTLVSATDTQSSLARYQTMNLAEGVLRNLTPHWWLWLEAGAGIYRARLSGARVPIFTSYVAGGGAGYRGRANTFGLIFNRGIGDSFGLGSGSTFSAQAGWNWHRPGSNWGFDAGGLQERLSGGHSGKVTLWQADAGVTRQLHGRTYVRVEYAYLLDTDIPYGLAAKPRAHGVRLTFGWSGLRHGRPGMAVPTPGPTSGDGSLGVR